MLPHTPSLRLDGKRALVTGGSRGIGFGAAAALGQAGADVVIVARNGGDVDRAVAELRAENLRASGKALDVTDSRAVAQMVATEEPFDILVNSAGLARHASFTDVETRDYDAVMAVNVRAALFTSQAVARRLKA